MLVDHVEAKVLQYHKALLPSDTMYITQVIYSTGQDSTIREELSQLLGLEEEDWNSGIAHMDNPEGLVSKVLDSAQSIGWKPMRMTSSPFQSAVKLDGSPFALTKLRRTDHEYSVDPAGVLTSTLSDGILLIAYKSYPKDDCGNTLIPDEENLKEAISHFCMYRYWLGRSFTSDQAAVREREWHLDRYQTLSMKAAGILSTPSIDQLENIKNTSSQLVPRTHRWDGMFSQLG